MFIPIFSPLTHYNETLKSTHEKNVRDYFSLLEKQACVNQEENAKTVANYQQKQAEIQALQNNLRSNNRKKAWGIVGIILAWLATLVLVFNLSILPALQAAITALALGLGIFCIVRICKKINAKNKGLQSNIDILQGQANEFFAQAEKQVAPLNALFTDEDALLLFQKSFPSVAFDVRCSQERVNELCAYGFCENLTQEECMLDMLSGELYGYPFLYETKRTHVLGSQTYHGTLVIHWTTTERDSKGNIRTVHHSQTLHASVVRDKPFYHTNTALYFGNGEVPNVQFSRKYEHVEDKSQAKLERKLRAGEKKLEKLQDKALEKDGDFTGVLNTQFEILFNATNRTDEYDFREMFTPRAQESMVELLLNKEGYGDDFEFIKKEKLCIIRSEHAQNRSLAPFACEYRSHDLQQIKRTFLRENEQFLQSLYFDFAPLLLIPPFQRPLVRSEPIQNGTPSHYAHEALAYFLNNFTSPEEAQTPSIYKTSLQSRENGEDLVQVHAFSYRTENRTTFVPVLGGDGHMHSVPVHWVEYIPVFKTSTVRIGNAENEKSAPSGTFYRRGYYAVPLQ